MLTAFILWVLLSIIVLSAMFAATYFSMSRQPLNDDQVQAIKKIVDANDYYSKPGHLRISGTIEQFFNDHSN